MTVPSSTPAGARRAVPRLLLALLGLATAVPAQDVVLELVGVNKDAFGTCVDAMGDLDGDGYGDLAVGAHLADGDHLRSGTVTLVSGRTGSTLLVMSGPETDSWFGKNLAGIGDVNGDGVPDLAVAAPRRSFPGKNFAGAVTVHSGATGAVLMTWSGSAPGAWFAKQVHAMGDVDGDGVGDLLLSSDDEPSQNTGTVQIRSGATGAVLLSITGDGQQGPFGVVGTLCAPAGDLDADGVQDVAFNVTWAGGMFGVGELRAVSGATGALLHVWPGIRPTEAGLANGGSGPPLTTVGDIDGDGHDDLAVHDRADGGRLDIARVRVFSGATGLELLAIEDPTSGSKAFGHSLASPGDVDHDGVPDLAISRPLDGAGVVAVHSMVDGALLYELFPLDGSGGKFGDAMRAAGDVDGDGLPELAIGQSVVTSTLPGFPGRVRVVAGLCDGGFTTVGAGLAGTGGVVPTLTGKGCPLPGSVPSLSIADARGGAPAWLLWALLPGAVPFKGGTLYLDPATLQNLPLTLSGTAGAAGEGDATLFLPIPDLPVLTGLVLPLQAAVQDGAAPAGIAFTAGLLLTVG